MRSILWQYFFGWISSDMQQGDQDDYTNILCWNYLLYKINFDLFQCNGMAMAYMFFPRISPNLNFAL